MEQKDFDEAYRQYAEAAIAYPQDCARIHDVAARDLGIELTIAQADAVWMMWSATSAAGWLHIDDDEEIVRAIEFFVENPAWPKR